MSGGAGGTGGMGGMGGMGGPAHSANSAWGSGPGICSFIVRALKWLPVLFILTIVVWSYYAYVVQLCLLTVNNTFEKIIYMIFYHVLFVMFCWSYWKTIFTDIGRVPSKFKIPESEIEKLLSAENEEVARLLLERFAQDLPVYNRTISGAIRYCDRCFHVKPDRTHHCSVCGTCVLKMDHHCPWVNNCVSFYNYKFFILFLGYSLLYCIYIATTSLQYFIVFWKGQLEGMGRFHILFLFFVSLMFAISLISFFGYHCYLVIQNRSTLEAFRAPIFRSGSDKNGFSLGRYNNFQEVFGDNPKTWLLPVFTSLGDGSEFPVSGIHQQRRLTHIPPASSAVNQGAYNSMGVTRSSMGDGINYPQRHIEEDAELLLGNEQWSEHPPFSSGSASLLYDQ